MHKKLISDILCITTAMLFCACENTKAEKSQKFIYIDSSSTATSAVSSAVSSDFVYSRDTDTSSAEASSVVQNSSYDSSPDRITVSESSYTETQYNGATVWVSLRGKKYHSKPTCSSMKEPVELTVDEATARGYTPCSRCYK